ncbi:MAG: hypothetical protein WA823_16585 [Candidatus Acidiferrales bacterium]
MADAFAAAHRSRGLFIAGILFLVATAIDLRLAFTNHSRTFGAAGALGFIAGVLLFVASQQRQKPARSAASK